MQKGGKNRVSYPLAKGNYQSTMKWCVFLHEGKTYIVGLGIFSSRVLRKVLSRKCKGPNGAGISKSHTSKYVYSLICLKFEEVAHFANHDVYSPDEKWKNNQLKYGLR